MGRLRQLPAGDVFDVSAYQNEDIETYHTGEEAGHVDEYVAETAVTSWHKVLDAFIDDRYGNKEWKGLKPFSFGEGRKIRRKSNP